MNQGTRLTLSELEELKAEMKGDGERMKAKLQALKAPSKLDLPIWVSKTPYTPENRAERPTDAS